MKLYSIKPNKAPIYAIYYDARDDKEIADYLKAKLCGLFLDPDDRHIILYAGTEHELEAYPGEWIVIFAGTVFKTFSHSDFVYTFNLERVEN